MKFIIGARYFITQGWMKGKVVIARREYSFTFYFKDDLGRHFAMDRHKFADYMRPVVVSSDNPFNKKVGGI